MSETSLLLHLIELRKRLLSCVCLLFGVFFALAYFANDLYSLLARPLLKFLPPDHGLIATNVAAPLFIPYELTFVFSFFMIVPFVLYQAWGFIAPALYRKEKRMVWPLLFISTLLFYCGFGFAYFVVLPVLFKLLVHTAPVGVNVSPDMTEYFDFTLKLLLVFGVVFEVPVITVLLIWSGVVRRSQLIKFRPYAIVGAFVIGMLVAPPDVLSQTLLAVPLWLLFEAGIFLSKFWVK